MTLLGVVMLSELVMCRRRKKNEDRQDDERDEGMRGWDETGERGWKEREGSAVLIYKDGNLLAQSSFKSRRPVEGIGRGTLLLPADLPPQETALDTRSGPSSPRLGCPWPAGSNFGEY